MAKMQAARAKTLVASAFLLLLLVVVVMATTLTRRAHRNKGRSLGGGGYDITWAPDHVVVSDSGRRLDLLLDETSGAGFGSKAIYLFGHLSMQIRLVSHDSAGTIVAYYMSSLTDDRDEFSFQFLGGQPYTLQTNIFLDGVGGREQRFSLWFDPGQSFHSYAVSWNQYQIVFWVDSVPIRVFSNNSARGVPYAYTRPVGMYSSIWSTNGINWANAPFVASYQDLSASRACEYRAGGAKHCLDWLATTSGGVYSRAWPWDRYQESNLSWVKSNYLLYNYCTDPSRSRLPECKDL